MHGWQGGGWRKGMRTAAVLVLIAGLLFVFASNRFIYLSRQRFMGWAGIQWEHQSSDDRQVAPQIIGHRGSGIRSTDPKAAGEHARIGNTVEAIRAAIGANWIEIDIRASAARDGEASELIVFHDADVSGKTDGAGKVAERKLSELKALRLHVPSSDTILTLDEVFDSRDIPSRSLHWIFDVKAKGVGTQLVEWIKNKNIAQDRLILFGDYDVLKEFQGAGYPLGYTTLAGTSWKQFLFHPARLFDRCDELDCRLLVVPIAFVTTMFVGQATERGIDVWCYDTNEQGDLQYAVGCGVKGVIVDDPQKTMEMFGLERSRQ